MKRKVLYLALIIILSALRINAQEKQVENIPYADLKTFHFGVVIGTHVQDTEFKNMGEQIITNEYGIDIKKRPPSATILLFAYTLSEEFTKKFLSQLPIHFINAILYFWHFYLALYQPCIFQFLQML